LDPKTQYAIAQRVEKAVHALWEAYDENRQALEHTDGAHMEEVETIIYETFEIMTVRCRVCESNVPEITAHLHQGQWIGDVCCWTEQLRGSE
jgi:hypothetical protein